MRNESRFLPGDVRRYGADPTGMRDSTAAFERAFVSSDRVTVPAGRYRLSAGVLFLPLGAEIELSLGALVRFAATSAQFTSERNYVFMPLGRNRIRGGQFFCASDYGTVVWVHGGVSDITVERVSAVGATLLTGNSSGVPAGRDNYRKVTRANSPSRLQVINCRATATTVKTVAAGIGCNYVRDALYTGNTVHGYNHGITWWGGNSGYSRDGLPFTNPRKTQRITIQGNFVYDVVQGGIWGSMGENISVIDNMVVDAGDTGIDFEGDSASVASGNTVRVTGAKRCNVCISTFFTVNDVAFRRNTIETAKATIPLYGHYNASNNNTYSRAVSLIENRFICTDPGGEAGRVMVNSAIHDIEFSKNEFLNCVLDASGLGLHNTSIIDNRFRFTSVTTRVRAIHVAAYDDASTGDPGTAIVRDNDIRGKLRMAAGSTGIDIAQTGGARSVYRVQENRITEFPRLVSP
jgi:hypothetical protein